MQIVMENRIGDCEICQESCPWNRKHLDNPLVTKITESFQKKIGDWEQFFYLPDLVELSEKGYRKKLGQLNTDIPYKIFHRNILIAMERAKKVGEMI
jgi:epoxyqueuosine reductase QueG